MKENKTVVFVTGIGTDVGKTVVSAVLVEALQADYFKPVQAGELENTDTDKVKELVSNSTSVFHDSSYALRTPMSPHAAAEIDGVEIEMGKITLPPTENTLIVEGAGGLYVPINDQQTIFDLIEPDYHVVVVSRHYLGSINHTLLTLKPLIETGAKVSLIFNGNEHPSTEKIIQEMAKVPVIGRLDEESLDQTMIKKYANLFRDDLKKIFKLT